jgi:DNA-binding response OmpR family regulator
MARFMADHLRQADYETEIALDGLTADAAIESFRPGVVALDIRMPGLSGTDVLKSIRRRLHLRDIRILVITARPTDEAREALRHGADDLLQKPFEADALVGVVRKLLDGRNGEAGAPPKIPPAAARFVTSADATPRPGAPVLDPPKP